MTITVEDQNPPTANAGIDRTVGPGSVQLDGSTSSDGEGGDLTYAWTFASSDPSGTTVTLTGDDTAQPTFTAPNTAVALTFSLIVTDEAGNASTADTVVITVDTRLPTVAAGDDQIVAPNTVVTLNGSGSSNTGGGVRFSWTQDGGNPSTLTLTGGTTATPSFTSPAATGSYTLTLTVTDTTTGTSDDDSVTILVDATAPTAEAGPAQTVSPGTSVTLDGSGSTDTEDDTALTYAWALTASDPTATLADLSGITTTAPTFTAPTTAGTLTFTLTVTDGGDNTHTDTVIITVDAPPTAEAGAPQTVNPGTSVTLNGSGSTDAEDDTAGTDLTYAWALTASDPSATLADLSGTAPTFTAPSTPGTLTFTLTVTDSAGNEDTDTVVITLNTPPVAEAGDAQTVIGNAQVTLSGSGTDTEDDESGTDLTYGWALTGNPDTATINLNSSTSATATFIAPLTTTSLTFTLTVTDSSGGSDTDTVVVTVDATPPTAEAGSAVLTTTGSRVRLSGSASTDGQSSIASYSWALTGNPDSETLVLIGSGTATLTFTRPQSGDHPHLYPDGDRCGRQ